MSPSSSSTAPRVPIYRFLLIGAAILALIASVQHWAIMQTAEDQSWRTIRHALSREVPIWFLWVLAAPVIRLAVRRLPFRRGHLFVVIPSHVGIGLFVILAHSAALLALHRLLGYPTGDGPFWATFMEGAPFRITLGMLGYTAVLGAILAADFYGQFRERELAATTLTAQLAEARLQALRMQLSPHFLFNTMNTIAMLVRRGDTDKAVGMLAGLSDILRYVLEETPPQEVTLQQELAFIQQYLDIERARFGDRLHVVVEAPAETRECLVPNLVLQPVVENAIRHGISQRSEGGRIQISAGIEGSGLVLTVTDDGPGAAAESGNGREPRERQGGGIGLRNTRSRLTQLYGSAATLTLATHPERGTTARIVLPYHTGPFSTETVPG